MDVVENVEVTPVTPPTGGAIVKSSITTGGVPKLGTLVQYGVPLAFISWATINVLELIKYLVAKGFSRRKAKKIAEEAIKEMEKEKAKASSNSVETM